MSAYREVRLTYRTPGGKCARTWTVEVDPHADVNDLLSDLVRLLNLDGDASGYSIQIEGSLADPVLVITGKGANPCA